MGYIELKDIAFRYNEDEPYIFSGFRMSVNRGDCVLLEGDNGSGKTTLFRILNGLSFPERGEYIFDDTKITREYLKVNANSKRFHKRVGYLFQNPDIMLFNARVYDEIAFGLRQTGLSDQEVDGRVQDLLRLFELSAIAGKAPYHLSGGQKKRVALAAVMALNPEVVILDEPYAGLDRKAGEFLTGFLGELKDAGKTIIMASHQMEMVPGTVTKLLTDVTLL